MKLLSLGLFGFYILFSCPVIASWPDLPPYMLSGSNTKAPAWLTGYSTFNMMGRLSYSHEIDGKIVTDSIDVIAVQGAELSISSQSDNKANALLMSFDRSGNGSLRIVKKVLLKKLDGLLPYMSGDFYERGLSFDGKPALVKRTVAISSSTVQRPGQSAGERHFIHIEDEKVSGFDGPRYFNQQSVQAARSTTVPKEVDIKELQFKFNTTCGAIF